jgi:hypothetical protein
MKAIRASYLRLYFVVCINFPFEGRFVKIGSSIWTLYKVEIRVYWTDNRLGQSPSGEANGHSDGQEI